MYKVVQLVNVMPISEWFHGIRERVHISRIQRNARLPPLVFFWNGQDTFNINLPPQNEGRQIIVQVPKERREQLMQKGSIWMRGVAVRYEFI